MINFLPDGEVVSPRKFCKVVQALTLQLVSKALREWMLPSVWIALYDALCTETGMGAAREGPKLVFEGL